MKVLIFMKENYLKPSGGPAGYCYNIYRELQREKISDIVFLPADSIKSINKRNFFRSVEKHLPKWINSMQIAFRRKHDYQKMIEKPECYGFDFSEFDAVHFHSTIDLFKYRKALESYKGKVVLTTHSPVPSFQEIYNELPTEAEKRRYKSFYAGLEEIDRYSFLNADYVIFPCPEAEESYLNNWKAYKHIHDQLSLSGKLHYITTGIEPKKVLRDRETVRTVYDFSEDAFVVSYAGRHNQVKGYDLLQKIAQGVWEQHLNYQFIICGKELPLTGLADKKWTEVGWTDDSQSIIACSDVFVLPNRETYFDIIMLEVLSAGKIVVASRTGGNKYFERIGAKGVFLYDNIDEAVKFLRRIETMPIEERKELEKSNQKLFYDRFTTKKYVESYRNFLYDIVVK